jgi:hypothetical protein
MHRNTLLLLCSVAVSACIPLDPSGLVFACDGGPCPSASNPQPFLMPQPTCTASCTAASPACLDANTLETQRVRGCTGAVCDVERTSTTCANGCVNGACLDEPCAGLTCETPPASLCVDASTLRIFTAHGVCTAGACDYPSADVACANGCANGKCNDEPCVGVTCASPPSPVCVDATTLRVWNGAGACDATSGACVYGATDVPCSDGCSAGRCARDACAGISCDAPPAPTCVDATTRRTWASMGTCAGGTCAYTAVETACAAGCSNGACLSDPCTGVACVTPPANDCVGNARRLFSAGGTCSAGSCSYASVLDPCAANTTCTAGLCVPNVVDAGTPPSCTPARVVPVGTSPVNDFTVGCAVLTGSEGLLVTANLDGDASLDVITDADDGTTFGFQTLERTASGWRADGMVAPLVTYTSFPPLIDDLLAIDLTGDGRDDLVALDGDGFEVFLNDGAGHFSAPRRTSFVPSNLSSRRVLKGDFNADCRPDFAVLHDNNQGRFSIVLSAGDGGIASRSSFKLGSSTASADDLALGDFDGDGKLDVAASNASDVRFFWGEGDGGVKLLPDGGADATILSLGGGAKLHSLDWDHDRDDDLLVRAATGAWSIVKGNSSSHTFSAVAVAGSFTRAVAAADFNADGWTDLLGYDTPSPLRVQWMNRSGSALGSLHTATPSLNVTWSERPVVADVNADGRADVLSIISQSGDTKLCTWFGQP